VFVILRAATKWLAVLGAGLAVVAVSAGATWLLRSRGLSAPDAGPEPMSAPLATLLRRAGFTPADTRRPAPPFEVRDVAGVPASADGLRGQVVLLFFWGADCPHCVKACPGLERLAQERGGRGLVVLPIRADESDADARPHAGRLAAYADPAGLVQRRYDVTVLPTAVLLDRYGRLVGRAEGALDWSAPAVGELLDRLLVPLSPKGAP
jgi:thiol-disulfide isomerase/thioredoxin